MTLDEMCLAAARYSDRYDEMEKNEDGEYEDDALHYFNVFRDAINEAYREISRKYALPDTYVAATVDELGQVNLARLEPSIYCLKEVLNAERSMSLPYTFETKFIIDVDAPADTPVTLCYHYMPPSLEELNDAPVFNDAQADPMIYISLAVARMWQSEKKFEYANHWMSQYYTLLRDVRSGFNDRSKRRIPRRQFR